MTDDPLRQLIASADPIPAGVPMEPADSPRARALLEEIMTATLDDRPAAPRQAASPRPSGRRWLAVAAAVAIGAAGVGALALRDDGSAPTRQAFSLPGGGPVMASCLAFDVNVLAQVPVAFAGTVTALTDTTVTVQVDRWYKAPEGTTDLVDLTLPAATSSASLDGVAFEVGRRYLLTATDGNVNGCGLSGLATPELEAAFDQAFG